MPRPQRIEYENAFYHVMNRGRARQTVFHDKKYYEAFLDTLAESSQRFHCVLHAYCLMGNHYHLLIETPLANLGRIMRHINSVYTQRHNRLKKTDGPLFRGRYKAILVDKEDYLLQLTRYIHRNPIDMKKPLVRNIQDYRWSSYPAYIASATAQTWLHREITYNMLGHKHRYKGYATYVASGNEEDITQYYNRGNMAAIIGGKEFKAWVYEELLPELEAEEKGRMIQPVLSMETIIKCISNEYHTTPKQLTTVVKGPQEESEPRKIAMYLSQELAGEKLKDIANYFGLNHVGSVSYNTHQVRKRKRDEKQFSKKIDTLITSIMRQMTYPLIFRLVRIWLIAVIFKTHIIHR